MGARRSGRCRGGKIPEASPAAMRVLMRLWKGDTVVVLGGVLALRRAAEPELADRLPQGLLDELEYGRRWIESPHTGVRVRLTPAGAGALARWAAAENPDKQSMTNPHGETLVFPLRRVPSFDPEAA